MGDFISNDKRLGNASIGSRPFLWFHSAARVRCLRCVRDLAIRGFGAKSGKQIEKHKVTIIASLLALAHRIFSPLRCKSPGTHQRS